MPQTPLYAKTHTVQLKRHVTLTVQQRCNTVQHNVCQQHTRNIYKITSRSHTLVPNMTYSRTLVPERGKGGGKRPPCSLYTRQWTRERVTTRSHLDTYVFIETEVKHNQTRVKIHMHTHTHKNTHAHTQTHTHTHTQNHAPIHTHTYSHRLTRTHT